MHGSICCMCIFDLLNYDLLKFGLLFLQNCLIRQTNRVDADESNELLYDPVTILQTE